jgi:hypothetical protein
LIASLYCSFAFTGITAGEESHIAVYL